MKKHWTLNYIINRIKLFINQRRHPNDPWLTKESVFLLNQLIKLTDVGFEFGSGRSTKWLGFRCKYLYSVEHNKIWFDKVSTQIKTYENIEYSQANINYTDPPKSEYLTKIKSLENSSLDFVLNDGKIRDEVALVSIEKLREGGLYILDNAERYLRNEFDLPASMGNDVLKMTEHWSQFFYNTSNWRRIWTTDGVSSTLIMFKP